MASTAIKVRRTPFFFATAPRAVVKRNNMVADFRNGSWYLTFFLAHRRTQKEYEKPPGGTVGRPSAGAAAPRPVVWRVWGARWRQASAYGPQACHWWAYVPWPRSAVGREIRTHPPPRAAHAGPRSNQRAPECHPRPVRAANSFPCSARPPPAPHSPCRLQTPMSTTLARS